MAKTIIPKGALPPLGEITGGALDRVGDDVRIFAGPPEGAFEITTSTRFFQRLWNLLTNPITYLFSGKIRW